MRVPVTTREIDRSRRRFLATGAAALVATACSSSTTAQPSATTGTTAATTAPAASPRRTSANTYLTGNLAPVPWETTALDLEVEGTIPAALEGTLLRNGPNPIDPDPETYHWFLGDGMLHALTLSGGRATYRSRWTRTDPASQTLAETPPSNQPVEVTLADNAANINVVHHGGRVLALYEVALPTQVTVEATTVGRFDFDGALRSPMTAHPKIDPVSGELVFFGLDFFAPPHLRYHVADPSGRLTTSVEVPIERPSMMHDFAVTQTRVVFLDLPVVYDLALLGEQPFPARWDPTGYARLGVMDRAGGDVQWIEIDPCFVFHVANAYDDDQRIVIDVAHNPSTFTDDPYGPGDGSPRLQRWTVDPAAGTVDQRVISDLAAELPTIDPRRATQRHGVVYAPDFDFVDQTPVLRGLRRFDLDSGTVQESTLWDDASAGEAIFVPADASAPQDEGWVLSVVYDAASDTSSLAILEASDFSAGPVARVHLPTRVPVGFHGTWIPVER